MRKPPGAPNNHIYKHTNTANQQPHNNRLKWLMIGDEVPVRHICQIKFTIGEDYEDTVWRDVLPMDNGDILLGCPWMYDKNGTHAMCDNRCTHSCAVKRKLHSIRRNQNHTKEEIKGPCHKRSASCLQRQHEEDLSSRSTSSFNLGGNYIERAIHAISGPTQLEIFFYFVSFYFS